MKQLIPRLLIILAAFILTFCAERADPDVAVSVFSAIEFAIEHRSDESQEFIDKATETVRLLRMDNNALIDVAELKQLLDTARSIEYERLNRVKLVKEVDKDINLKKHALGYLEVWANAYDNAFVDFINLMTLNADQKYNAASTLLSLKLIEIKNAESKYLEARKEFMDRYGIERVE